MAINDVIGPAPVLNNDDDSIVGRPARGRKGAVGTIGSFFRTGIFIKPLIVSTDTRNLMAAGQGPWLSQILGTARKQHCTQSYRIPLPHRITPNGESTLPGNTREEPPLLEKSLPCAVVLQSQ